MIIAICTNISNGIGLAREYQLLRDYLQEFGHSVTGLQYDEPPPTGLPLFDLMISLETVQRKLLPLAPIHWIFVNPEWAYARDLDVIGSHFSKVFCKTREAERILKGLFPDKTHYVGFLTRDQFDPSIPRTNKFLHIGGNSSFRGTQAIIDAWKWQKNGKSIGENLVVISAALKDAVVPENVTLFERVSEEELCWLQNECAFHLYPSGTEGFGHALHEAMGVNAVILTTDAAPMNEIESAFKLKPTGKTIFNLAEVHEVSAIDIYDAVHSLRSAAIVPVPRKEFLAGNNAFRSAFAAHLENFNPKKSAPIKHERHGSRQIAFLGNFESPESTENLVKWALEDGLGQNVWPIQENRASRADLDFATLYSDAFLWVRTPNWLQLSDAEMEDFLQRLKIPSFGLHLDKFWGIPEREALIGIHPFWKLTHLFTADGSRDEDFKARGVNHHWMKPAMSEVHLHRGIAREDHQCDVAFVGARSYHREYPFREHLVTFLEDTYRGRFRHVTNIRGHNLNDFYASASIIVGDCIFAGTPHYWSDRLPETCGRYGFLLHPEIEGMDIPVATYKPQDLEDLRVQIDWWLQHDHDRHARTVVCAEHVRRHDTWTIRMAEILKIVGF